MGVCVFCRKAPSFSPLTFNVDLPCFETIWEAETAAQCLHELQTLPVQIRLSTAMQLFRSNTRDEPVIFEASAFAMSITVLGESLSRQVDHHKTNSFSALHCSLYQAMQNLEPQFHITDNTLPSGLGSSDLLSRLEKDCSGNSVTMVANELVSTHGTSTLRWLNGIFDKWQSVWALRGNHDSKYENRTFSADPVRFWWLAKLYIILHFVRNSIQSGSKFAVLETGTGDLEDMRQVQRKVVRFLLGFRSRKEDVYLSQECYLSSVLGPINDDSGRMTNGI